MSARSAAGRAVFWGVCAAFALSTVAPRAAAAEPGATQQCIDDHANGQVARGRGALLEAKRLFSACTSSACPDVVRSECAKLGADVDAALPSVLVIARAPNGEDAAQARLSVDAAAETVPVDGRALFVDPGQHQFRVVGADGAEASVTAIVHESEKYRRIVVQLPAKSALAASVASPSREAPPAPRAGGVSPLAYVFGGVGLLAAGSFTFFALDGRSRQSDLEKCAPRCQQSDADAMRRSYLIGDVSLGVALASLGAATYFFLASPAESGSTKRAAVALSANPQQSALRVTAIGEF